MVSLTTQDLGTTSSGSKITSLIGATAFNQFLCTFGKADDGHLWCGFWNGAAWAWSDMVQPTSTVNGVTADITIGEGVGVLSDGAHIWVFVCGGDGNLWCRYWSGGWAWVNVLKPPSTSVAGGVTVSAVPGGGLAIYVRGNDGHLWCASWSGAFWQWLDLGTPSATTMVVSRGDAVPSNPPAIYVPGSDGHLWLNRADSGIFHWVDLGVPQAGVSVVATLGNCLTPDGTIGELVQGSDGLLWLNDQLLTWKSLAQPGCLFPTTPSPMAPIAGAPNVGGRIGATSSSGRAFAFVFDDRGKAWVCGTQGAGNSVYGNCWGWTWVNFQGPSSAIVEGGGVINTNPGSSTSQSIYLFVRTNDGHIWCTLLSYVQDTQHPQAAHSSNDGTWLPSAVIGVVGAAILEGLFL